MNDLNEIRIDSDENSLSSLNSIQSKNVNLTNEKSNNENNPNEEFVHPSLEDEPFYFETDTLALRNNPDYSCLLKTLILLEGQRIKACEDLEKLNELKEEAMNDPISFVNKLNKNSNDESKNLLSTMPIRQKVYVLPEIDWNKYYDSVDLEDLEAIKNQKINRVQSLRQSTKLIQQLESGTTSTAETSSNPRSSTRKSIKEKEAEDKSDNKKYNKSWSVEEQRHLEELLIEFPPEDNEAARWRKIANKLGTRTPLQVQSHCQKYFIKLAKAGLPIPGRMPNLKTYVTKKGSRGRGKTSFLRGSCSSGIGAGRAILNGVNSNGKRMVGRGVSLNEISSMWTSFNPPVTMGEENELNDQFESDYNSSSQYLDDNESQNEYEEDEEEEEEDNFENDQDESSQQDTISNEDN